MSRPARITAAVVLIAIFLCVALNIAKLCFALARPDRNPHTQQGNH